MTGNGISSGGDRAELDPRLEYRFMTENRRAWRWMKLLQEESSRPKALEQLKEIMPTEVRAAIADVYRRAG
jgi:hypothetical protein